MDEGRERLDFHLKGHFYVTMYILLNERNLGFLFGCHFYFIFPLIESDTFKAV